ncbi:MAG: serine/threonine-protein kinase, partial [Acidobacteriota bacterium]
MSHDFHQLVKSVFMEALVLEPEQRRHFLRERCADNPDLRSEVESLLSFHETATGILDKSPDFHAFDLPEPPARMKYEPGQSLVGTEIGPYRLREFLGQGGMGLVYLATQREPVHRSVALKIVKSDSETVEVLARFEAERQVLAQLEHPCIARIYEAGATAEGRPYFTMEYVQGIPLNEFCDRNRLSIQQRLDLFTLVCEGIQHAHQKGIIHRDLKPSNILVAGSSEQPQPKVIDFGVAKALHQAAATEPVVTAHGYLVGTPDYMSPEQAVSAGLDVDTRSDIYSLGAILYEILCGVLPLDPGDPARAGLSSVQHRILNSEPIRPSQRLGQLAEAEMVARARRTRPGRLARQLRTDLDWIVLTALAKDRERRYATVSELSADLARFRRGEPIQAGPPSVGYRLRKYLRRNLVPLVAITAVMLALASGLVASLNFARQSERARQVAAEMTRVAQQEAHKSETASKYLRTVLQLASPLHGGDPDLTLLEAIEQTELELDGLLTGAPEVNAATHLTIAEIHRSLGFFDRAETHASQGVQMLRELPNHDPIQLADALVNQARAVMEQSDYAQAVTILREALALCGERGAEKQSDHDPLVNNILANLTTIAGLTGNQSEAADIYRQLIAHQERQGDGNSVAVGRNLMILGHFLAADACYEEGERHLRRALVLFESLLGEGHMFTTMARYYLGSLFRKQGDLEAALPLLKAAADTFQTQLKPDHPYRLRVQRDLAATWSGLGRYSAAESLFASIRFQERQQEGVPNQAVAITLLFQGDMFAARGERERALGCYLEVLHIADELFPDTDYFLKAMAEHQLALDDVARGDLASARDRLERCLAQRRRQLRATHPRTIQTVADLARIQLQRGAFGEA